jgi:hypothetical protein
MFIRQHLPLDQTAPWLISGAAGCYIVARTRQLSQAEASHAPWLRFLAQQSDVILMLCGGPAIWYLARRSGITRMRQHPTNGDRADLSAEVAHQLRQVFTVLLLGLGMIARRAPEGKAADLVRLARRLQSVTRTGASMLAALDTPLDELAPVTFESGHVHLSDNGSSRGAT